jgi:hypothetical protein
MFWWDFPEIVLITQATQAIGVSPKSKIQITVKRGDDLLVFTTGSQTSKINKPIAIRVAAARRNSFVTKPGALRKGPRTAASNKSAASHSTGVLRNHP